MTNELLTVIFDLLDAADLREMFEAEVWFGVRFDRGDGLPLDIGTWPNDGIFCGEQRHIQIAQVVFVDNSPDGHGRDVCDPAILLTDTGHYITLHQLYGENCLGFDLQDDKTYEVNPEEMETISTFAQAWATLIRYQGWFELVQTGVQSCQFPRSHVIDIDVFNPLFPKTGTEGSSGPDTRDFWEQEYPVASITRENLVSDGFPHETVETLTDADMQEIASAMEDVYFDHGYWEDLALCTNRVLVGKQEEMDILTAGATEGDEYEPSDR